MKEEEHMEFRTGDIVNLKGFRTQPMNVRWVREDHDSNQLGVICNWLGTDGKITECELKPQQLEKALYDGRLGVS
jgi:acyl CoA:acetate/3-ketoacid CoA transferase alpha subunit